MSIKLDKAESDLPINTKSSAKNTQDTLTPSRSMPNPELLSSSPRLEINKLNRSGDKLQPAILNAVLGAYY